MLTESMLVVCWGEAFRVGSSSFSNSSAIWVIKAISDRLVYLPGIGISLRASRTWWTEKR